MRSWILLALPAMLAACSGGGSSKENKNDSTAKAGTAAAETCYRRVQGRDTFSLRLVRNGDQLSGDLGFANYEKDSSRGTVAGKATGNVLRMIYVYESEGSSSVMEIFFRQEGNALVRGVGAMEAQGDTLRYSQPGAVQYPAAERWEPIPCSR